MIKFNGFIEHGDCCQLVCCDGVTDPLTVTYVKMANPGGQSRWPILVHTADEDVGNVDTKSKGTADEDAEKVDTESRNKFHKAPDQKIKKELTTDKNTANFDIEKEDTADVDIENEESSFSVAFNRFKFFKGCLLF